MKTIVVRPTTRLIHAFQQRPFYNLWRRVAVEFHGGKNGRI
jgi:hypothetical protein